MHLLSEDEIARLRQRRADPAFAAAWGAIVALADRALREPVAIPTEGAGWGHDFFCPEHAMRLEYDPERIEEGRCPVDGRVFTGEPYAGAWRSASQRLVITGLHAAALAWLAGGEERYAAHARATLSAYADRYPNYTSHGEHAGQGRCMGQSLDEAVWSILLAWAYDAVRETFDPATQVRIERDLLRPAAEHLLTQLWRRIHNIECWHLAGLATLGAVLGDERYFAPAFDEAWGLAAQLREGVDADGWWWEGSPTYHFYTLEAVLPLATALRRRHPGALPGELLRKMLNAPLAIMRADLSLPATNDGWYAAAQPGFVAGHAARYELARGLLGDTAYDAMLARLYAHGGVRDSVEALLFGPDTLPSPDLTASASIAHAAAGYAVLRGGPATEERWLLLKFGPHGGGHGHPDKLALDLHAFGRAFSADLGTPGYGIPLNRSWYRHTLSHNAILLGGTAQPPATGELVRFVAPGAGPFAVADARVSWPTDAPAPYAGVSARRVILWKPGAQPYFLDLVLVQRPDDAPGEIDLAWHHRGTLDLPGLEPGALTGADEAYAHLRDVAMLRAREWHATWRIGAVGTALWALDPPGTTLFASTAPDNPASESRSLLLRRGAATNAMFGAVFEPFSGDPTIQRVIWEGDDPASEAGFTVRVEGDDFRDIWRITARSKQGSATMPTEGATLHTYLLDGAAPESGS